MLDMRVFWSYLRYHENEAMGIELALSELPVGTTGVVESLDLPDAVQHHLMHMGFVPEARVAVVRRAPAGDPTVYSIDGFELALRRETARSIMVRATTEDL